MNKLMALCALAAGCLAPASAHGEKAGPPEWVFTAPKPSTQISKTPQERGINACAATTAAPGTYSKWRSLGKGAWLAMPKKAPASGAYDVVLHFHGKDAARRQWAARDNRTVLVGIDAGLGSGAYLKQFEDPTYFRRLMTRVHQLVSQEKGFATLSQGRIALSSWSAGYGATMRILIASQGRERVDAVFLLDGLHTSVNGTNLSTAKLEPFARFASAAKKKERLMVVAHSSIIPPGYASTTLTSNYLVWRVGGRPESASQNSRRYPLGLEPISQYTAGDFYVRGFKGNGKQDHCAQFGVLGTLAAPLLESRWGLKE